MASILPAGLAVTYTSTWRGPFDGRELTLSAIAEQGCGLFPWRIDSPNPWWSRPLKLGEVACSLSHLRCWQDGVDHDHQYLVVLEDDVCLAPDFRNRLFSRLAAAQDWDLLYLGRLPQEADRGHVNGFAIPGYSHCTYGYALTQHAARLLLSAGLADALIPVDEFLPAMYLDHPREDVRARFPARLRALAFDPPIVWQLPKEVAGSDTEDTGFVPDRSC